MNLPPIYFYIPRRHWPANLPEEPESYWQWNISQRHRYLADFNWTLQTYLHLKADGFPCQLVDTIPEEGIVLAHRYWFHDHLKPNSKLLIVCLRADVGRHPYAQLHVVQNLHQEVPRGLLTLWESHYIPLWPQPGLIPRDRARGDRFENIAYIGVEENLASELQKPSWQEKLKELGFQWHVVGSHTRWNDYSNVDALLAVRSFKQQTTHSWKPPSKLVNAWLAGVPAILGCESAFQAVRKSELDYLEVTSVDEVISALERLRDDKELRRKMVENGQLRAEGMTPASLVKRWSNFLKEQAVPAYDRWCKASESSRQLFLSRRYLALKINHVQERLGLLGVPRADSLKNH